MCDPPGCPGNLPAQVDVPGKKWLGQQQAVHRSLRCILCLKSFCSWPLYAYTFYTLVRGMKRVAFPKAKQLNAAKVAFRQLGFAPDMERWFCMILRCSWRQCRSPENLCGAMNGELTLIYLRILPSSGCCFKSHGDGTDCFVPFPHFGHVLPEQVFTLYTSSGGFAMLTRNFGCKLFESEHVR